MILAFQTSTLSGSSYGVLTSELSAWALLSPVPKASCCPPRHSQGSRIPYPKLSICAKSGFLEKGAGLFVGHKIFLGLSLKRKKKASLMMFPVNGHTLAI